MVFWYGDKYIVSSTSTSPSSTSTSTSTWKSVLKYNLSTSTSTKYYNTGGWTLPPIQCQCAQAQATWYHCRCHQKRNKKEKTRTALIDSRHSHSSVYQSCAGPEILTKESGRRRSTLMQVWNIQGPLFGRQSPFIGMVIRTMPNFALLPLRGLPLHASLPLNRFLECRLIAPLPFTPFSSRSAVFRSTHMLRCQRVGLTL